MTPRRKRHLTYVTIGLFFLLSGVEYAVILPTLWLYLDTRFHAPSYFLGFVLSACSVADLLAAPHLGRWSDRSGNTKLVLLVANVPQILGSLIYFVGITPWLLVVGRFVAGLGSGIGAALIADIAQVTTVEERTPVISVFMALRQVGLLLGPGCNLFLQQLNFSIGPLPVDIYTSPGLFMAILWSAHELLTLFMFWNLPELHRQQQQQQLATAASDHSAAAAAGVGDSDEDAMVSVVTCESPDSSSTTRQQRSSSTWQYYVDEFIRDEVVAILGMVFISFFNQDAMEAMLTPLTQKLLHWGVIQNSILFCGAGAEVILVFLAIQLLSRRLSDRTLILIGQFLQTVTIAFLLWFVPQASEGDWRMNLPALLCAIFVDVLSLPLIVVASSSLYSKITRHETQGLAQGVRRVFVQLGVIIGPLWAGSMVIHPYWMFGVMLAMNTLLTIPLLISYGKLQPIEQTPVTQPAVNSPSDDERHPLLS